MVIGYFFIIRNDIFSNTKINKDEFRHAMTTMGEAMSLDEVNEMLKEVDLNGDGTIDYKGIKIN
jgi:calmodulin